MAALVRLVARWPGVITVAVVAAVAPGVLVVSAGDEPSGSPIVVLVLGIGLVVAAVVGLAIRLSGVDPEAEVIADGLVERPHQRLLLERWLRRTRWARNVGGVAALMWWLLATNGRGNVVAIGLGGVALGSMAAQLHQVRSRAGVRTASIERRTLASYRSRDNRLEAVVLAGGAVVVMAVGALNWALTGTARSAAIGWAASALAVLALGLALQWRVATRPRPALPPDLRYADDLARMLAIGPGLGVPAGYWAAGLLSAALGDLGSALGWPLAAVGGFVWFYALVSWWQNRGLGLRGAARAASGPESPAADSTVSDPVDA